MRRNRVSMAQIAELAGVSKPVVYTVLNKREGKGIHVGPKTREKILALSKKMGYVAPEKREGSVFRILQHHRGAGSEYLSSVR